MKPPPCDAAETTATRHGPRSGCRTCGAGTATPSRRRCAQGTGWTAGRLLMADILPHDGLVSRRHGQRLSPARPIRDHSATSASSPTSTMASRPGRPDAAPHRCRRRTECPRAVPRPDGHRAWRDMTVRARPCGCRGRSGRQRAGRRARHVRAEHDPDPGHVDFTYEVSGRLEACETAVLLVDAAQGIEAQTLANLYLALGADLQQIIRCSTRSTCRSAQPEKYAAELRTSSAATPATCSGMSAKTGMASRRCSTRSSSRHRHRWRGRRAGPRADLRLRVATPTAAWASTCGWSRRAEPPRSGSR